MDSCKRSLAKVVHAKTLKKVKTEKNEKTKKDKNNPFFGNEDNELHNKMVKEAFLAKLFATISSVKSAYAQLQFAQSPYDEEGIQSADQIVISELKSLSDLKQCYVKNQLCETSPEKMLILSEIQEQSSLLKTYEITSKKLDSQLKLKESELTFLKEKLAEANKDNKLLEKRLNSSGQIVMPANTHLASLNHSHFVAYLHQAEKYVRNFVRLMIDEMESADWDLESVTSSIEPGVSFWETSHRCFAFESYVCKQMFDDFGSPNFSTKKETLPDDEKRRRFFFDLFTELKSVRTADYLARKPKSAFARFCRAKYLKLVHPKMEVGLFGNLDMRNLVSTGQLPENPFFVAFSEMAKRIWVLHCLALSFDPVVTIFQVSKGTRFSEVYMKSLNDEAFSSYEREMDADPRLGFMVVPGFRVGRMVIQCQVYLV